MTSSPGQTPTGPHRLGGDAGPGVSHAPDQVRSAAEPGRPPLLRGMWASLRGHWDDAPGYRRLAYVVGLALMGVGLAHAAIWAVVGGSASGPVSWRKPTTFGISFGMTTVTLGWVAAYLPVRRTVGWIAAILLCTSATVEVAWVSLQRARAVPAHFNTETTLDERLFVMGGVAIAVTFAVVAATTLAGFVRTTASPPLALAIRTGLLALLAAQAVGLWMILHGTALLDADADPRTHSMTTYGAAGAMKFIHAVPMHAIQVLGALALLLSGSGLDQRRQLRLVALAAAGYAALFGVALLRTVDGLVPFDPGSASTAAYLLAVALLAVPAAVAIVSVGHRLIGQARRA
jgi:hypothetical protein